MSTESARRKLQGHGRVLCKECKKVIITCKCVNCSKITEFDICDECERKKESSNHTLSRQDSSNMVDTFGNSIFTILDSDDSSSFDSSSDVSGGGGDFGGGGDSGSW